MKKYDVFCLYVIKVPIDDNDENVHYLICDKDIFSDNYVDILTKTKVKVEDESYVTLLSDYFSPLAICNYSNGKHLMLSKSDILEETIKINMNRAIKKYKEKMDDEEIKTNPNTSGFSRVLINPMKRK